METKKSKKYESVRGRVALVCAKFLDFVFLFFDCIANAKRKRKRKKKKTNFFSFEFLIAFII